MINTEALLLICRSWCPDRTLHQARKYIADAMGERYAEGVILNLEATWEESNPQTPLICFLSMGSDPTGAIENLAKRKGIGMYEKLKRCINSGIMYIVVSTLCCDIDVLIVLQLSKWRSNYNDNLRRGYTSYSMV